MQAKFVSVTTELLSLACLARKPDNSFGIAKFIEDNAIDGTGVSLNQVYTALFALCEKKYVRKDEVGLRGGSITDRYTLLPEGEMYYKKLLGDYNKHIDSVSQILKKLE